MRRGVTVGIGNFPHVGLLVGSGILGDGGVHGNGSGPRRDGSPAGRWLFGRDQIWEIGRGAVALGAGRHPISTQRSRVPVSGGEPGRIGHLPRVRLVRGSFLLGLGGVRGDGSGPRYFREVDASVQIRREPTGTRPAGPAAVTGGTAVAAGTAFGTEASGQPAESHRRHQRRKEDASSLLTRS